MSEVKILADGTEVHYTKDGKPWYWVPSYEAKLMREADKEWEKKLAKILWGK